MDEDIPTNTEAVMAEHPKLEFKKPILVGKVGKLPKKSLVEAKTPVSDPSEPTANKNEGLDRPVVEKPLDRKNSDRLLKELPSISLPYKEPKWSGLCPDGSDYAFEVLKSGMIVENIDLTQKPFYVFGRLGNCDVVMAHPTISRHHAVLQYKAFAEESEPPSGWYLYDLGSSHGTFLNKAKLKAHNYCRVRVGHQIKFGTSTRTYVLTGPDFDCEGESDLTVTEIKAKALIMKSERDRMILEAKALREKEIADEEKRKEDAGIDWGMGEDAEDEQDLTENPYAVTSNESLYLDDPKKTLRGYFEREGLELVYDCEERGQGQFVCRLMKVDEAKELCQDRSKWKSFVSAYPSGKPYTVTLRRPRKGYFEREGLELVYDCEGQGQFVCMYRVELPIDDARGKAVKAEVIHKGKKKEAVIACALEACRILDRAGLLRQAKHESRRRKERDWSADDYYDSDDDNFLDRTGSIERKRDARMRRHGGEARQSSADAPLTYDTLQQNLKEIESKIAIEEKSLARLREVARAPGSSETGDDDDPLDNYMQSLVKQGPSMAQKADISNTKMIIKKLQAELAKTQRLADIARPAHLPPLVKKDQSKLSVKVASNSVVYGKRIRLKDDQDLKPKPKKQTQTQKETEFVEEMDSDEEEIEKASETIPETVETNTETVQETNPSNDIERTKSQTHQLYSETKSEINKTKTETNKAKSETNKTKSETDNTMSETVKVASESSQKKQYGPMRPPENYVIPESYFNQNSNRDLPEIMED